MNYLKLSIVNCPLLIISSLFILHSSLSHAQDTSHPVIMSQSSYDSILNALKKNAKHKDTVNQVSPSRGGGGQKDTAHVVPNQNSGGQKDSAKQKTLPMLKETIVPLIRDSSIRISPSGNNEQKKKPKDTIPKSIVDYGIKVKPPSTGYIAFNFGLGLPVSDYATIGAAITGRNFSISAEFPGQKSRFGWAFKLDYGFNGIDANQYLHVASEYVLPYDQGLVYSYIPLGQHYTYYALMAGICKTFPLGKIAIDARMMIGVLEGMIPQTSYNVLDTTAWNTITVNSYKSSAGSFAFSFGLDVRYQVLPDLSVLLNFDYLTARPTFQIVSTGFTASYSGIEPTPVQISTFTQPFVLNNVTLGVGYTINAKKAKR